MTKYAILCHDMPQNGRNNSIEKCRENGVKSRKIRIFKEFWIYDKSVIRLPRQHQYFTLQTVQTNRISVALGIWNIRKLENERR